MKFSKLIIILSVTIIVTICIMFGVSYGWYAYASARAEISVDVLKTVPTIIFTQNEYINISHNSPIYDEDRYQYANKNSFIITVPKYLENYDVGIEIFLSDIKISNELKIDTYKYELLMDDVVISKGSFSNIGDNTSLSLLPMTTLNVKAYPETHNYVLYTWLSEDGTNQNNLMNKHFSAKINVNSATKRK